MTESAEEENKELFTLSILPHDFDSSAIIHVRVPTTLYCLFNTVRVESNACSYIRRTNREFWISRFVREINNTHQEPKSLFI